MISLSRRAMFLVALFALGCGGSSSSIEVTGTLLKDGVPFGSDGDDQVMVSFNEAEPKGQFPQTFPTIVPADGRFVIKGPGGQGVPPGKYKVCVAAVSTNPSPPPPADTKKKAGKKAIEPPSDGGDKLKGAFSDQNTPWTVDVSSSNSRFSFDVVKVK